VSRRRTNERGIKVVLLLGCVELLRRFQWAILRVEWELVQRHRRARESSDATPHADGHGYGARAASRLGA
jgi:hypothetical protein